jgi:hypothetical protein
MRPELPEGHPGRLLPFNVRDMLRGIDEDKDGAASENEWKKAEEGFEQSDVPVLMALRPGQFPKSEDRVAWTYGKGIPEIPSPLAYDGKLFLIRDGGLLQCMDTQTGTVLYHERLILRLRSCRRTASHLPGLAIWNHHCDRCSQRYTQGAGPKCARGENYRDTRPDGQNHLRPHRQAPVRFQRQVKVLYRLFSRFPFIL